MRKSATFSLFFILLCFLLPTSVVAEPPTGDSLKEKDVVEKVDHLFDGIVAKKSKVNLEERRKELLKSVEAIEDKGVMVSRKDCLQRHRCKRWEKKSKYLFKKCNRRLRYCFKHAKKSQKKRERIVTAALKAEKATGIDATFLIAVGRMESDFRPLQLIDARCGQPLPFGGRRACGADCGITQHRIYGKAAYVRRMCKRYASDYNLVFLKSAKELARHVSFCKTNFKSNQPLNRCVMNRYNQGTYYKTRNRCRSSYRCNRMFISHYPSKAIWYAEYKGCKRGKRKCFAIAAYWTKLSCFYYGARNKIRSKRSCRRCFRIKSIRTKFYPPSKTKKPTEKLLLTKK